MVIVQVEECLSGVRLWVYDQYILYVLFYSLNNQYDGAWIIKYQVYHVSLGALLFKQAVRKDMSGGAQIYELVKVLTIITWHFYETVTANCTHICVKYIFNPISSLNF